MYAKGFFRTLCILAFVCSALSLPKSAYPPSPFSCSPGVAFAFSGAGGRIAQLTALAEALINGSYPNNTAIKPCYLAGVSSGALISVAISAVMERTIEQNNTHGFTFDELNDLLFSLQNSDVFTFKINKAIDAIDAGHLLDTTPLKNLLSKLLQRIQYSKFGDSYLPMFISVVDQRTGVNVRLFSTNPQHANLPMLDVLLSTTAIPVAFQPGVIPALSKYSRFLDGATGVDSVPIAPLLSIPSVHTVYVITYNYALSRGIIDNYQPFNPEDQTLIKYALQAFDIQLANLALGSLALLASSQVTGYIYEPNFTAAFSTVDFASGRTQFMLAHQWALIHNPIPIRAYLSRPSQVPNYTLVDEILGEFVSAVGGLRTNFISFVVIPALLLLNVDIGGWEYLGSLLLPIHN